MQMSAWSTNCLLSHSDYVNSKKDINITLFLNDMSIWYYILEVNLLIRYITKIYEPINLKIQKLVI